MSESGQIFYLSFRAEFEEQCIIVFAKSCHLRTNLIYIRFNITNFNSNNNNFYHLFILGSIVLLAPNNNIAHPW